MKQKVFAMVFVLLLQVGLVGCSNTDSLSKLSVEQRPQAEYPYYEMEVRNQGEFLLAYDPQSIDEQEEKSDYIVQGYLLEDSQPIAATNWKGEEVFHYTVTSLMITKVWKGELKEGDTIQLCEWYSVEEQGGKNILWQGGNYMPSEVGKEYLFFLNSKELDLEWVNYPSDMEETIYSPAIFEKGRYPVPDELKVGKRISTNKSIDIEALSNEDLNLAEGNATAYKKLYSEVIEKYF